MHTLAALLLAVATGTPNPTPASTSTPTPAPVVAAGTGATRTLSDLARERKLVGTPNRTGPTRAGGFSAAGSTVAPQAGGQSADTTGCSRSAEAKLDELNRRNLSPGAYSDQKRRIQQEEVDCSVLTIDKQNVADAEQELEGARAGVGQALRDLPSYRTKQTAAQVLKAAGPPAKRNVTTTVGRDGTVHTSEQWVYPGIGYVYFRDGILETVQTR